MQTFNAVIGVVGYAARVPMANINRQCYDICMHSSLFLQRAPHSGPYLCHRNDMRIWTVAGELGTTMLFVRRRHYSSACSHPLHLTVSGIASRVGKYMTVDPDHSVVNVCGCA